MPPHAVSRQPSPFIATAGLALAFLLPAASPARADASTDQAAILKAEQDWVAATESGNKAALEKLLHPTFINVSPVGGLRSRAEAISAGPPPAGSTQTLTDMKVRTYGDSAVVTGVNRFRPSAGSAATDVVFTDVYIRTPQGWQVVSSHNSVRPGAVPPAAKPAPASASAPKR